MNKKRIIKSIIRSDELEWDWNMCEDKKICRDCGGNIFYIKQLMGVIREELDYGIVGYKDKIQYALREYGFKTYCAECGEFEDIYFIDKVDLIYELDDLGGEDKEEIEWCLGQFNQKKTYEPRYKSGEVMLMLEKLKETEKLNSKIKLKEDKK